MNDIAVLQLAEEVIYRSGNIATGNRRHHSNRRAGKSVWMRGLMSPTDNTHAHILRTVELPVVSRRQCAEWLNSTEILSNSIICAGFNHVTSIIIIMFYLEWFRSAKMVNCLIRWGFVIRMVWLYSHVLPVTLIGSKILK